MHQYQLTSTHTHTHNPVDSSFLFQHKMFNVQELNVIMHRTYSPKLLIPNSVKEKKNDYGLIHGRFCRMSVRLDEKKKKTTWNRQWEMCAKPATASVAAGVSLRIFYGKNILLAAIKMHACVCSDVQSQSFAFFAVEYALYLVWRPSQRWPSLSVCLRRMLCYVFTQRLLLRLPYQFPILLLSVTMVVINCVEFIIKKANKEW